LPCGSPTWRRRIARLCVARTRASRRRCGRSTGSRHLPSRRVRPGGEARDGSADADVRMAAALGKHGHLGFLLGVNAAVPGARVVRSHGVREGGARGGARQLPQTGDSDSAYARDTT
jgi:hypothetical protein